MLKLIFYLMNDYDFLYSPLVLVALVDDEDDIDR